MVKAIPEGMHSVTAQLTVNGATEAIEFYKRAFGAVELDRAPDPSGTKIWHAMLKIGDSVIFVNDSFPEMGGGAPNETRLWLYTAGVDAAFARAVAAGATMRFPLMDMFWGDRMGGVVDPWGNHWTLAERTRDLSPAEMERGQAEAVAAMKKPTP